MYLGIVFLGCIPDLYFSDVSRICISRMCSDGKFLGSKYCTCLVCTISRMCIFSDVYLQYFSDVLLGSNIKQVFSDLYEKIDFSDLNFSENLDTSEKVTPESDTLSEKSHLGSDRLLNPRDLHVYSCHVSTSD